MLIRGGTSKGAFFLADDLPADKTSRDRILLAALGSPDERQIDGIGGGDSLTSKVAIVRKSSGADADVDYLFAQVVVNEARVDYGQNCGNILAGIGPFAIEKGLVSAASEVTAVRVFMENTGQFATARVSTPHGQVDYSGDTRIDGVPGTAAAVVVEFADIAGSSCGALLPTGESSDIINGIPVTCIDNGMPVVIINAEHLDCTGYESAEELNANLGLKTVLESIRLAAGLKMNLGDVKDRSVPKMCIVSPPKNGGAVNTRTFIPHHCHTSIGVFGAVSVGTACLLKDGVLAPIAESGEGSERTLSVEHPSGEFTLSFRLAGDRVESCGLVRTARLLFDGQVLIPAHAAGSAS